MSLLATLARVEAVRAGRAQPLATVRHRHLSDRPMAFVPLTTAGEVGAPLGALVGTRRDAPRLLVVPQPRDRDLRFAFLADLAAAMLPHFEGCQDEVDLEPGSETDPETGKRVRVERELCRDAPQLLVPNGAGVQYVRLLGRSARFRRTAEDDGREDAHPARCSGSAAAPPRPDAAPSSPGHDLPPPLHLGCAPRRVVPERVPLLGRWLTHYGERALTPGSALLLAMTDLLSRHWATGQSALEDQHLGALLGWIDPPRGRTGADAAWLAESARGARGLLLCPPAGPATDPEFDNRVLAPAVARYDARIPGAEREVRELVESQLQPAWDQLWRGLEVLRSLPPGEHVEARWKSDRWSYTGHRDRIRAGEPPQPRVDDAVTAARKLARRETDQVRLDAHEALDDPLVMAERRLSGEAFEGEVAAVLLEHSEGRQPRPRPRVTVRTEDGPHVESGAKVYRALGGRTQEAHVVSCEPGTVVVRLLNQMGRGKAPAEGSVPEPGDRLCFTAFEHAPRAAAPLPEPEATPWTHGGPPGDLPAVPDPPAAPRSPAVKARPAAGSAAEAEGAEDAAGAAATTDRGRR